MATLYQLAVVAAMFVVLSSEGPRVGVVLDRERSDWTIRTSVDAEPIWTGGKESWGRVDPAMANKQCFSILDYCSVIPCSEMYDAALNLLCGRQGRTKYFFALVQTRPRRKVF